MEYISERQSESTVEVSELHHHGGEIIKINGVIHKIREMSGFAFIILRTKRELLQCVIRKKKASLL